MSKSQIIAIIFDGNSENVFYAGQLVTGHVHVQTSERIKMRGIRLELTGKAKTSWTEGTGDDSTTYIGKEKYMNLEINLIGSRSHDSVMYLEPSVTKYPFSFVLPPELPQSFEDKIGHIRYKAKAVIDRPLKIDDKADVSFTVIHLVDLNLEPSHLREPQVIHSEAPASGCCCVAGFAEINVTINRGCFVPGETIFIDGEIANRTNTNVEYSTITLIQKIEYCATKTSGKVYHRTHKLTTLAKFERPFIRPGYTDSWSKISVVVPPVFPSRFDGCAIINITHYFEISVTFYTYCSKSEISSEIVIGNIPLRNDIQPSVVTSQPTGFPKPFNMCIGPSVDLCK